MTYGCIVHIILAFFVGWIAQRLLGYRDIDFLTTLIVGLIGSYIGNVAARAFHLPYSSPGDSLQVWAQVSIPYSILGCIFFIIALNLIAHGIRSEEGEE